MNGLKERLQALKVKSIVSGLYEISFDDMNVSITNYGRKQWHIDFSDECKMSNKIENFRYGIFCFETKREAVYYAKCFILEYKQG